jgi:hypothetical protein
VILYRCFAWNERANGRKATPALYAEVAVKLFFQGDIRDPSLSVVTRGGSLESAYFALVTNTTPWTYAGALPLQPTPSSRFDLGLDAFALTHSSPALTGWILSQMFFPSGRPVGATMTLGGTELTVIGVVDHIRLVDIHRDGLGQVFIRNDGEGPTWSSLSWALRTHRTPTSLIPEVRAAVRRVDQRLPLSQVRTMEEVVGDALRQQRISAVLIGGFSLGALLLAAMGLFGLITGSVTRRRHELAVRIALGAGPNRVLRLVLKEGAALVLLGLLLGLPGVYFGGRLLQGMLYGVSPSDPATLVAVALGLTVVAMAATYVPARRVLGIEPAKSLRDE